MVYASRFGQNIFDVCVTLKQGLDNVVVFALNAGISDLTEVIPAGKVFSYEVIKEPTVISERVVPQKTEDVFIARNGQSIYDIALMLNGGLDNVVAFSKASGVDSLMDPVLSGQAFTYLTGQALTNWAFKNNYIFANSIVYTSRVLATEDFKYIVTELGYKLLLY